MITELGERIIANRSGYISEKRVKEAIERTYDNMFKYGEPEPEGILEAFQSELLKELGLGI